MDRGGCADTGGIYECVRACKPRECCVYAFTSGLLSLPVEEEEGDLTVYSYVL